MGKRKLAYFSSKCFATISLLKQVFAFSHVEQFGYNNSPNEGNVKFLAKFGASRHFFA